MRIRLPFVCMFSKHDKFLFQLSITYRPAKFRSNVKFVAPLPAERTGILGHPPLISRLVTLSYLRLVFINYRPSSDERYKTGAYGGTFYLLPRRVSTYLNCQYDGLSYIYWRYLKFVSPYFQVLNNLARVFPTIICISRLHGLGFFVDCRKLLRFNVVLRNVLMRRYAPVYHFV